MSRILLVEDERILAMALRQELVRLGFDVTGTATNGPDAIRKAREADLDVVIMDISIEGEMTGIDTAIALAEFSPAKVVYLTGEADADTRTRAMATPNARGYLTKPLDTRELLEILELVGKQPAIVAEKKR